ncbi:MAG: hypothetical protein ACYTJ0_15155, partial [Planctomycetota bacterium]
MGPGCPRLATTTILPAALIAVGPVLAQSLTDFDATGFEPGTSVHGYRSDGTRVDSHVPSRDPNQPVWSVRRAGVDEELVDLSATDPAHGKAWRLSDRTATGGLESRPHAPKMDGQAGESTAVDDFGEESVTTSTFVAEMDFRSVTGGPQPGLSIQIAATCGSDCRQAIVRITDGGSGFDLEIDEPGESCRNFLRTPVDLDLSYDQWHTLMFRLTFVDGFGPGGYGVEGNDVLEVFVDGVLVYVGTSWETCYAFRDSGRPRSVDRLSFGRGSIRAASVGGGLYFDNVTVAGVAAVVDSDGDGVPDGEDECSDSDLAATVVVGGRDSGVPNHLLEDGCTVTDLLAECRDWALNHGEYVSCAAELLNDLKAQKLIRGREKGRIQRLVAK